MQTRLIQWRGVPTLYKRLGNNKRILISKNDDGKTIIKVLSGKLLENNIYRTKNVFCEVYHDKDRFVKETEDIIIEKPQKTNKNNGLTLYNKFVVKRLLDDGQLLYIQTSEESVKSKGILRDVISNFKRKKPTKLLSTFKYRDNGTVEAVLTKDLRGRLVEKIKYDDNYTYLKICYDALNSKVKSKTLCTLNHLVIHHQDFDSFGKLIREYGFYPGTKNLKYVIEPPKSYKAPGLTATAFDEQGNLIEVVDNYKFLFDMGFMDHNNNFSVELKEINPNLYKHEVYRDKQGRKIFDLYNDKLHFTYDKFSGNLMRMDFVD